MNISDLEFTLLSEYQADVLSGTEQSDDVIKQIGTKAQVTDVAILEGCRCTYDAARSGKNTTGCYMLESTDNSKWYEIVKGDGSFELMDCSMVSIGIRPVIKDVTPIIEDVNIKIVDGVEAFDLGERAMFVTAEEEMDQLDKQYASGCTEILNKTYTLHLKGRTEVCSEILCNNKKYICVYNECSSDSFGGVLSNGLTTKHERHIWIKVEPVIWYYNRKTGMAISKYILSAGIPYSTIDTANIKYTDVYKYLNTVFKYELIPSNVKNEVKAVEPMVVPIEKPLPIPKYDATVNGFDLLKALKEKKLTFKERILTKKKVIKENYARLEAISLELVELPFEDKEDLETQKLVKKFIKIYNYFESRFIALNNDNFTETEDTYFLGNCDKLLYDIVSRKADLAKERETKKNSTTETEKIILNNM